MRQSVDIGITIDERLADGYYYSKTVKLLKYLLENPELWISLQGRGVMNNKNNVKAPWLDNYGNVPPTL